MHAHALGTVMAVGLLATTAAAQMLPIEVVPPKAVVYQGSVWMLRGDRTLLRASLEDGKVTCRPLRLPRSIYSGLDQAWDIADGMLYYVDASVSEGDQRVVSVVRLPMSVVEWRAGEGPNQESRDMMQAARVRWLHEVGMGMTHTPERDNPRMPEDAPPVVTADLFVAANGVLWVGLCAPSRANVYRVKEPGKDERRWAVLSRPERAILMGAGDGLQLLTAGGTVVQVGDGAEPPEGEGGQPGQEGASPATAPAVPADRDAAQARGVRAPLGEVLLVDRSGKSPAYAVYARRDGRWTQRARVSVLPPDQDHEGRVVRALTALVAEYEQRPTNPRVEHSGSWPWGPQLHLTSPSTRPAGK